ncbi:MMPL family transporter [bacterium]|nr:MMPL family transporter [bacterium]
MASILKNIARFSYNHYRLTLSLVGLVTVLCLYAAAHLQLQTNFVSLLPQQSRTVRVFFESVEDFGMSDFLVVCLRTDDQGNSERMMELADLIVEELAGSKLIEYIDYRLGDKEKDFYKEIFLRNMVLFMDSRGIERLQQNLTDDSIRDLIKKNKELLLSQVSLGVKKLITEDPLRISEIYQEFLPGQKGNLNFDISDGYYLTRDQKMLLILVKPVKSIEDFNFNRLLLYEVEQARDRALAELDASETSLPGEGGTAVTVSFTGGHVITLADHQVIKRDIIKTVVSSFIAIVLLFVFAFRRIETMLYIGLPLVTGVIWNLAFSYLTIGSLNLITSVLSAIILGLGVDFAIHLYNRFLDERVAGQEVLLALETSLAQTGVGVLTGAVTTAVAFFAMLLAPFRGLAEFGFMAGSGILFCFLSVVLLLPALIRLRLPKFHCDPVLAKRPMSSFFVRPIAQCVLRFPRTILSIGIIITLAALTQVPKITFSDSLVDLRAQSNKYMKVRDEIQARTGGSFRYFLIVIRGPDIETVIAANERLMTQLDQYVRNHKLNNISSITDYIPSRSVQQQNIDLIRNDPDLSGDRIERTFIHALEQNGFRFIPAYQNYIRNLKLSLAVTEPFRYQNYRELRLERILKRFVAFKQNEVRLAIYLFPREKDLTNQKIDYRDMFAEIRQMFQTMNIDADITGTLPVTQELKGLVISSINRVTLIALLGVILVLAFHFRRTKHIIAAMLPMSCGLIWMLGSMPLVGLSLNFFNIAIIPIIVGIGIDNGVHILHRYKESRQNNDRLLTVLTLSGKAVVLTSLTTILAFGSLYFSDYKGLATMGYLAITGVGFSLLASIFILPALIAIIIEFRTHNHRSSSHADT